MRYPCNLLGKPAGRWPLSSDPLPPERWHRRATRTWGFMARKAASTSTRSTGRLGLVTMRKHRMENRDA